jgi:glyoxylase-like metal-dependent hydrolase (beta-lactamase superfamily II)
MSSSALKPTVTCLFEEATFTCTYIVSCPETRKAAVIDSVLDFDPASGRTSTVHNEKVMRHVEDNKLDVDWVIETHVHADHLTGAQQLRDVFGAKTAIGSHVTKVQQTFKTMFNLGDEFKADGSQFDHLIEDGEEWSIGEVQCQAVHTPGHTPACMTYLMGDALFTGDTIFMPDFGSARCDFPGGSATELYSSVKKLLSFSPKTRMFVGHDYMPNGREVAWETTVEEEANGNLHINKDTSEEDFVLWRTGRDAELGAPRLLLPSLQVNLRGGEMPPPESNGVSYLKIPINVVGGSSD